MSKICLLPFSTNESGSISSVLLHNKSIVILEDNSDIGPWDIVNDEIKRHFGDSQIDTESFKFLGKIQSNDESIRCYGISVPESVGSDHLERVKYSDIIKNSKDLRDCILLATCFLVITY